MIVTCKEGKNKALIYVLQILVIRNPDHKSGLLEL